jgi:restriction system protein
MSRRRKPASPGRRVALLIFGGVVILALVVLALWYVAAQLGLEPEAFVIAVFAGTTALALYALVLAVVYFLRRRGQQERMVRALRMADVDGMDGYAFERYVAQLLARQGYRVTHTGHSGDLGVDLVAQNHLLRYAVQIKRQVDPVSRRAVSDAVAGMAEYGCNAAMVVTNNYFSPGAQELARSNRCVLIDRDRLANWILEFQGERR